MILNSIINGLSRDVKRIILFDLILFIIIVSFVNTYKTFFLLLTGALVAYLSYRLVTYFIEISTASARPSCMSQLLGSFQDNEDEDLYEFKLANFLFRNATLIRTLKKISRNRFVKFSINNCPLEEQQRKQIENNTDNIKPDEKCVESNNKSKYDEESVPTAIARFSQRIRYHYVERWYHVFVSNNDQFPREVTGHCEVLLNDIIARLLRMEKLKVFSDGAYMVNNNFMNMAIFNYLQGGDGEIPLDILHPALRNSPASEMAYFKRIVVLGFRRSLPNISINEPILEELFAQIIGKNVFQYLIDLFAKPNFMWWCIGAIVDKEKAMDDFAPPETDEIFIPPAAMPIVRQQPPALGTPLPGSTTPQQNEQRTHRKSLSGPITGSQYSFRNPLYEGNNADGGAKAQNLYFEIITIKIVDTEISVELKSGKEFTLYNIQFEYRLRDLYATKMSPELNSDVSFKKLKRRYKEFVQLQKSLEDNTHFKHYLKNIKSPAKYLVLPIGNMEIEYVEKRRKRLNDYLNSLIRIPEICQSKEMISFLELDSNEYFTRSWNLLNKFSGVLEKISPVSHFSKKNDELDLAIQFGQLSSVDYEYTDHDSYEKFFYKLDSVIRERKPKTSLGNSSSKQEAQSFAKKPPYPPPHSSTHTHFTKQCFEIWNKAIVSALMSSPTSKMRDGHCWLNNKNVYRMIEVGLLDYYLEDFFHEMFNGILSNDFMVIYLQFLEYLLFEKRQRAPINFDDPKHDFKGFALKQIFDIVPKIAQVVIGEEIFKSSISLLINSLGNPILNKHIVFSVFDLILLNIYGEDFMSELQNNQ